MDGLKAERDGAIVALGALSRCPPSAAVRQQVMARNTGVVREEKIHHGTIGEERTRLVRFEPASQR